MVFDPICFFCLISQMRRRKIDMAKGYQYNRKEECAGVFHPLAEGVLLTPESDCAMADIRDRQHKKEGGLF